MDPMNTDNSHHLEEDVWHLVQVGARDPAVAPGVQGLLSPEQQAIVSSLPPFDLAQRMYVQAYAYGGKFRPLGGTLHSVECPLRTGYAESVAKNWFATPKAGTSAHYVIDPRTVVQMLPLDQIAYHVGNGNRYTVGYEQSGYAAYSRADWLTPDGLAQLKLVAGQMRKDALTWGWPLVWASDSEARNGARTGKPFGFLTHDDNRRIFGGTTHTDPMPNYPKDELMDLIRASEAPHTPKEEPEMISRLMRANGDPTVWLVQGASRVHVPNEARLADLRQLNTEQKFLDTTEVRVVDAAVLDMFPDVTPA